MSNGLQTFMRMANLYNPQTQGYSGMPNELPIGKPIGPEPPPTLKIDEEVSAEPETSPTSTLEAFRQSVLNPPMRTRMTYPKNTLAGLEAALQVAATPTEYEKNRVYVNGNAYQRARVYKDPTTGEKKYITEHKQPSFMSQVLKAMPAAVSPATDILNQEYADTTADWEMRNKGLKEAIGAESAMALAKQRGAQAEAIPARVAQGERALDIKLMDAQTRQRLASLKDLPDSEKMRLLQENKITIEELRAANQYSLQELRGEQKTGQIEQQGKIRSGQIAQQGKITSGHIEQRGGIARDVTRIRGEEARKTKATPGAAGASAASYPTQQRVAMQSKASQIANERPEWAEFISINEEGFPEIEPPSWHGGPDLETYNQIYQAIYGTPRGETTTTETKPAPKSATTTITTPAPTKKTATPPPVSNKVIKQYSPSRNQTRISTDGGKTWKIVSGKQ